MTDTFDPDKDLPLGAVWCPFCNGDGVWLPDVVPPDKDIAALLEKLNSYAVEYADKFWRKYDKTLTGLPTDNPERMTEMIAIVRKWAAKL